MDAVSLRLRVLQIGRSYPRGSKRINVQKFVKRVKGCAKIPLAAEQKFTPSSTTPTRQTLREIR